MKPENLNKLVAEIRACRICEAILDPRPIIHVSKKAKLCIASQAPGLRVHKTGISFNDPSGDRLREWMGVDRDVFYDDTRVALTGMAFCFPGYDAQGHDLPPPKICATTWRTRLFAALPQFETLLLVGSYAQDWHLGDRRKSNMTETVKAWREYAPRYVPMPHPSWRNNGWLKQIHGSRKNSCPILRRRVRRLVSR